MIFLGISLSFSDLTLTVLPDVLINDISCMWLTLKAQCKTLCMTLVASYWAVNVSMGNSRAMRGMRLVTECNFRRLYMVNVSWLKPDFFCPSVLDGLKFWEGDKNVVFIEVNCPGDHAEGGQRV